MSTKRSSPTTRSSNAKTTDQHSKEVPFNRPQPSRAHRDDTPEAIVQRERAPKTHPGTGRRTQGAARKEKTRQEQQAKPQEQNNPS